MVVLFTLLAAFVVAWVLAYHRMPAIVWTAVFALALWGIGNRDWWPGGLLAVAWVLLIVMAAITIPSPLRRALVGAPLLKVFRRILPAVSQTEQEALEAGTVWWDGELFSGKPDWNKLLAYPKPRLTAEEQVFIDGPLRELCEMLSDWEITHEMTDMPPPVWQFIKDHGFLGMIIPREYGGKGFSALAHSQVVMQLTTRSGTAAVSVMVPNSLGPAELLLHYGTRAQKDYYLPRLAKGIEIPCFALTNPEAGSDAGGIPDFGIVCRSAWQGKPDVLGIRLTWEKRYITLGPIATLLGLAFRLYDPDHLLGQQEEDIGITLALVPTDTPGVHIGRRHRAMTATFMNGPNWGKDVFIPMEYIIGGVEYVGQGWKMLMNSLAAGRSISLPANGVGIAKLAALTTGAYGRVRQQFKLSIGRFEGVEEAMARIAGNVYVMDAARMMTAGAVDLGEKPSVVSAIVKYHLTERGRQVINDAMDVHGGKGICMGPNNYLASAYIQTPIAITVEGANILTRTMIIFGQGAIRGHPFVLKEIEATREQDPGKALRDFDRAFFGHLAFTLSNVARVLWMGMTGARLTPVPGAPELRHYYQQLTRLSSGFALTADMAMFLCGGTLKRRERLSARLGDVLSQLYLASTVLKRFEDDGRPEADLPLVRWGLLDCLYRIEESFYSIFENLPWPVVAWVLRGLVFPLLMPYGREFAPPRDPLGHQVVGLMMTPGPARERLTRGVFVSANDNDAVRALESALVAVIAAEPVDGKLRQAQQAGRIAGRHAEQIAAEGLRSGIITQAEFDLLRRAATLRRQVIMVDDFPQDFGKSELQQTTQPVTFEALARKA
ncbi:MAG: acyl-CoA dehydrogenase [Burkholderiales bacterium]|nr:acyl-CoA dehydrogenase [Burkholderiales bacterium]